MKPCAFALGLAITSVAASAGGQSAGGSFFPYVRGDSAVFNLSYPNTHAVWVSEEYRFGGTDYRVVRGIDGRRDPDTLRVEGDQVIRLENGVEYVLYDFSLPDGSVYLVQEHPWADTFRVSVEYRASETVPVGTFSDCVRLLFDIPLVADDEWLYAFCRGVGLVWHGGGWGGGTLEWATIGGVVITGREDVPASARSLGVYPNPVSDRLTVGCSAPGQGTVRATVFDVRGRAVREMEMAGCDGEYPIDVSDLAPGIYLIRVGAAGSAPTREFVVIR